MEAALDRYPDNKSLLNLRNKLNDIFQNSNKYIIGESTVGNYVFEPKQSEKTDYKIYNILSDKEIDDRYNELISENIILTKGEINQFVNTDFDKEIFGQINNFENLRDIIASFKEVPAEPEEQIETVTEDTDYFSLIAGRIGEGKLKVKQEVTKPTDTDDEPYIVSETMAQIYEIQKAYTTAIKVYKKLSENYPEKKEKFLEKISELEKKLN